MGLQSTDLRVVRAALARVVSLPRARLRTHGLLLRYYLLRAEQNKAFREIVLELLEIIPLCLLIEYAQGLESRVGAWTLLKVAWQRKSSGSSTEQEAIEGIVEGVIGRASESEWENVVTPAIRESISVAWLQRSEILRRYLVRTAPRLVLERYQKSLDPRLLEALQVHLRAFPPREREVWDDFLATAPEVFTLQELVNLAPSAVVGDRIATIAVSRNDLEGRNRWQSEVLPILAASSSRELWGRVPSEAILRELWFAAPAQLRLEAIISGAPLPENEDRQEVIEFLIDEFIQADRNQLAQLVRRLPAPCLGDPLLFYYFPPVEQVERIWRERRDELENLWSHLDQETKVRFVYRTASEIECDFPEIDEFVEQEALGPARLALKLWRLAFRSGHGDDFESAFDEFRYDFLEQRAYDSTEPFSFPYLFAACTEHRIGLQYCEGQPWIRPEERARGVTVAPRAWCPRGGEGCCPIPHIGSHLDNGCRLRGARLFPDPTRSWHHWSVLELIDALNARLRDQELPQILTAERIPELAGYINRINEIRPRLQCRTCGRLLRYRTPQPRHLARQRVRWFYCPNGHQPHVYLNHCWACERLLDNRDSCVQYVFLGRHDRDDPRPREQARYLCLHCGSGPQAEEVIGSLDYTQGDICPSCGAGSHMHQIDGRIYECQYCQHRIILPRRRNLTGPRDSQRANESGQG
jgi:hypothetical protein